LFDISLPLLLKEFIIKQVACANVARSPAYFESTACSSLVPPFLQASLVGWRLLYTSSSSLLSEISLLVFGNNTHN
jgi:hypothetical protein